MTPFLSIHRFCQSEVQNLHSTLRRYLDVCGFQIPVDDPSVVSRLQRRGDLTGELQGFLKSHRTLTDPFIKSQPLDELHGNTLSIGQLFESVDLR
jgi:hypothetical protein